MKRVIVADDDPGIQDVLELIFRRAGYHAIIFNSADEILENHFEEPDVFLIDKELQGVDGLDVCRFLKNRANQHTPVIIFSASGQVSDMAKAAGADDFLEKPFKIKALFEMIEQLTPPVI